MQPPHQGSSGMHASASRPLYLHCRQDLEFQQQIYLDRLYWVIKDPLALKYYRFEEEEVSLLKWMDGNNSLDQIKRKFDFEFAPQKISFTELNRFSGMLYRNSLLVSELPGQGMELKKRGEKNQWAQRKQSLSNILAIRFKGVDPDRFLGMLNGWCGWIFSWPAVTLSVLTMLAAAGLIFSQFELFMAKLPTFQEFFAAKNWMYLAIVLAITKVLHEFGHGLACKRYGAQCHEMGFMLLVLTPCLYVNVSDSWLLPSKWKRIAIAAAGMYVEFILAALAVFVWWFSHPGLINQLALNVIFVCSVSTLIINANPLLRYDGYYIAADWLEIPNLRSKATALTQRWGGKWLLGIDPAADPFLPHRNRWLFISYSLAAIAYRWVITFTIFWFVYRVMEPYGLKVIGQLIALMLLYSLLVAPVVKLVRYFSIPGRLSTVKPPQVIVSSLIVTAVIAGIGWLPIPHYVFCSFYVQPFAVSNVYVEQEGRLEEILVSPNQRVTAGEPIFRMSNYQLDVQLSGLLTELEMAKNEEQNVLQQAGNDSALTHQIRQSQKIREIVQAKYQKRRQDLSRLLVTAPVSGTLLPPEKVPKRKPDSGELGTWDETPLDRKNIGAFLDQQTLVGKVVPDMKQLEAVLAIDQSDIEFIVPGQSVELYLQQVPASARSSTITAVSPAKMNQIPKALSSRHGGEIVVTTDKDGNEVPESTKFYVKVPLENPDELILPGSIGTARVHVGNAPLALRVWRLLKTTFHFEL